MNGKFRKLFTAPAACFILLFLLAVLNRTGSLILFWKEEPLGSITHDSGYGNYAFVRDENISRLGLPFFLKEDETILEQAPLSVNEDITASVKKEGGGRHQLLSNNDLYFSASDGSPEDHEYRVISPVIIRNRYLLATFGFAALNAAALLFLFLKSKDRGPVNIIVRFLTAVFFLMLLLPWNRMILPGPPVRIGALLFKPVLQRNWVFIAMLFILLFTGLRFSGKSRFLKILSVLILLVNTCCYFVPEWNWYGMRADSGAYLQHYTPSSLRTPGYPVFIESVYRLSGNKGLAEVRSVTEPVTDESLMNGITADSLGLLGVVRAQKVVLAAAFLVLFFVYLRYYDPVWFVFTAQIILCGGFLGVDNSYIMTECLSQAVILLVSACFLVNIREKSRIAFLVLCVLSGIGILIRPANIFLVIPIVIGALLLIIVKRDLPVPAAGILIFLAVCAVPAVSIFREYGIFVWMPSSGYAEIGHAVELMQPEDIGAFDDQELREFCGDLLELKSQYPDAVQNTYTWQIAVAAAEARGYDQITCSPLFSKVSRKIFSLHFREFAASLAETIKTGLERTRLQWGPVPFIAFLLLSAVVFAVRFFRTRALQLLPGMVFVLMHCAHLCISMVNQPERRYIYSTEILCLLGWLLICTGSAEDRRIV